MKKKTCIIIIVVVAIVLLCSLLGLWLLDKGVIPLKPSDKQEPSVSSLLWSTDVEQIMDAAEYEGFEVERYEGYAVVTVDPYDEMSFQAIFTLDKDAITEVTGSFISKKTIGEISDPTTMREYVNKIEGFCQELFGVSIQPENYHIYANEGFPLDMEEDDTYAKLAAGEAKFSLYVRCADDSLWIIKCHAFEGHLICGYTRHFNTEKYKDIVADITLE